ncbi:hypothetical protein R1sor_008108 [Riccia sorocarpa]|uniref:DUF7869 domain-containing protein n=1 Tax=Riccia sorocarpa TaxID=122646 RepID=A0ABD3HSE3_9MARC
MSGRSCYYSHNQLACDEPSLYKSSIHDGMDSSKTAVPRLDNYVKALSGVGMPVSVKIAGILNRGHGPPALAHVTIGGLWSSDPNFTVSSIAKYLRDCEDFDGDMKGDLVFENELHHPLLKAFMNKDIFTKTVAAATTLLPQHASTSTKSNPANKPFNTLPPTFYMQLDNSGKDNKNWVLMAFFSELVARGVFKTMFMYFLIVGHTHEDVDAFFSKVNRALSFQHISNIPQLMAAVMEAEEKKALPRFITEVADYKAHALPYRKPIKGVDEDLLAREAEEELVERNEIFVGNPSEMERERFVPLVDIEPGVMLLIRPCDGFVVKDCFWVAMAVSGVIRQLRPLDPPNTYEVKVEWYRPKHRLSNATDAQRYSHCLRNTQEWEKELTPFESEYFFVDASACVHQWKSKSRSEKLKIPESIVRIAREMLDQEET